MNNYTELIADSGKVYFDTNQCTYAQIICCANEDTKYFILIDESEIDAMIQKYSK